mgnify:CR=1 FL=1
MAGAWQSELRDYLSEPVLYDPSPTADGSVELGAGQTFSIRYKVLLPKRDLSMGLASIAVDAELTAMPVKTSANIISLPAGPLRVGFYGHAPLDPPLKLKP